MPDTPGCTPPDHCEASASQRDTAASSSQAAVQREWKKMTAQEWKEAGHTDDPVHAYAVTEILPKLCRWYETRDPTSIGPSKPQWIIDNCLDAALEALVEHIAPYTRESVCKGLIRIAVNAHVALKNKRSHQSVLLEPVESYEPSREKEKPRAPNDFIPANEPTVNNGADADDDTAEGLFITKVHSPENDPSGAPRQQLQAQGDVAGENVPPAAVMLIVLEMQPVTVFNSDYPEYYSFYPNYFSHRSRYCFTYLYFQPLACGLQPHHVVCPVSCSTYFIL
ncbi:hypothetical protein FB45DRAFT_936852 [Roridomyces roridus]|uniref:Uncharacterized protein n=1 Tax=Roridomyces roridus TaxID=1738132 RepID=A0AAD7B9B4_9AGAR|nr:hypothetical protein FB45DRAFT_936852 [Roridomyces roridus]